MNLLCQSRGGLGLACLASVALALGSVNATASMDLSESDRQALIDLYNATNGEQWRNNEGWLDEAGTECDWYGVECLGEDFGFGLVLKNNGLTGGLPTSLSETENLRLLLAQNNELTGQWQVAQNGLSNVLDLDLSNNRLEGFDLAEGAAPNLVFLRLSGNRLSGDIPEGLQNSSHLTFLDLSHNQLSGSLPDWLSDLELKELNLAGNALGGSIVPALAAMEEELSPGNPHTVNSGILLDLRANQFSGAIDPAAVDFAQGIEGWLNLCWNDLEANNPEVEAWLHDEHFENQFESCLGMTLAEPGLAASGSWFNLDRPGEGFSIMQLDDGQTMVYWFTYAPAEDPPTRQSWLAGSKVLERPGFDKMFLGGAGGGQFGSGLPDPSSYWHDALGEVALTWTEESQLQSDQHLSTAGTETPIRQHLPLTQLTQLAGTTCDNQSDLQQYSGAWYNPDLDGEGFVVEVLPGDRGVVYWFTFTPDGSGEQAWMMGDGDFEGHTLNIDSLARPVGTNFGEDFDPDQIEYTHWGSLTMTFDDDMNGHVWFNSEDPDFGSGDYPVERLARAKLADCGD